MVGLISLSQFFLIVAAAAAAAPLIFTRRNWQLRFRYRRVADDEAAAKYGSNIALRDALLFSRDCGVASLVCLVLGLLLQSLGY